MKLRNIKNLIFDLDGTLIDSSEGVVNTVNATLKHFGEPERTPPEITRFIGYPLEEMFHTFSHLPYPELWEKFQELGRDVITDFSQPIEGVDLVLKELHQRGYRLGIGTTKIHFHLDKIVRKFEWNQLFDALVGADDVPRVKPHPDAFLQVMSLLGGNTSNSLVVGDTINDLLAARAAGLTAAILPSPYGTSISSHSAAPDIKLKNFAELLQLLT